jgi:hypothetical protein
MLGNHVLAARDRLGGALPLRIVWGVRQAKPSMVMMFKDPDIERIEGTMTVPFQRGANRIDLGDDLCSFAIMGLQEVELLLQDFVNALVFGADLLQQFAQLSRLVYALGRELPNATRGSIDDQKALLPGAKRCHIDATIIDQLSKPGLRRALLGRRGLPLGLHGAMACQAPQLGTRRQIADGLDARYLAGGGLISSGRSLRRIGSGAE